MSTLTLPELGIQVFSDGSAWQIYSVVNDEIGEPETFIFLDGGIARTRLGMKFAVIRRLIPIIWHKEVDNG